MVQKKNFKSESTEEHLKNVDAYYAKFFFKRGALKEYVDTMDTAKEHDKLRRLGKKATIYVPPSYKDKIND